MSRIGKQAISIPKTAAVTVRGRLVSVSGPKGELQRSLHEEIQAAVENDAVRISPVRQTKRSGALWGLERALIANMLKGVTDGFEKRLEIEGIGYRAQAQGSDSLTLSLGFSHPVKIQAPAGITFKVEKNVIVVSGIDKALVGQIAADIRAKRPPEPYKGKGIRYLGEVIRRKAGKKAAAAGS